MVIVGILLLAQIALLVTIIVKFSRYFSLFYGICLIISIVSVIVIISNKSNPSYKIAWIVPIILLPVFGGLFYLMFGQNVLPKSIQNKIAPIRNKLKSALPDGKDEIEALDLNFSVMNQPGETIEIGNHLDIERFNDGLWEVLMMLIGNAFFLF